MAKVAFPSSRRTVAATADPVAVQQSPVMVMLGPPEFGKHSTTTESECRSVILVELGIYGPEQRALPVPGLQQPQGLPGEARPPGIAKQSATTNPMSQGLLTAPRQNPR